MENIYVLEGARTPFGSFGGSLKDADPTELGVTVAQEAMRRSGVSAEAIDFTVMGNVIHSAKMHHMQQDILHCRQGFRSPALH